MLIMKKITELPMKMDKTKVPGIKPLKAVKVDDKLKQSRPILKLNKPAPMLGTPKK